MPPSAAPVAPVVDHALLHPLGNAVWHSLAAGHADHADHADRIGAAVRYYRHTAPFAAVPDRPTPEAWADLAGLLGASRRAVLFRERVEVPAGWTAEAELPGVQLVAPRGIGGFEDGVEELTTADRAEATALVEATRPGPWRPRTIELGCYVGVRERGRLVALAGERLRPAGHVELSAVCTAPEARGRGLATRLVRHLVAGVEASGSIAFLHAAAGNHPAIRLYEQLGFEHSRSVVVQIVRPTGGPVR